MGGGSKKKNNGQSILCQGSSIFPASVPRESPKTDSVESSLSGKSLIATFLGICFVPNREMSKEKGDRPEGEAMAIF